MRSGVQILGAAWGSNLGRRFHPDLDLHCLRHSYATHLAEWGYDPLFISQQLGHSYVATTALYTHVSNDYKNSTVRDVYESLYKDEER